MHGNKKREQPSVAKSDADTTSVSLPAEIVLKHYFQPGQEDFRQALHAAMPRLLTNGNSKLPMDEIAEIVEKATEPTAWEQILAIRKIPE